MAIETMRRPLSIAVERTAAVFIDLQEEHRHDPRYRVAGFERVIANAQRLQAMSRRASLPIYHFSYVVDMGAETTRRFQPRMEDGRSAFSDKDDPLSAICAEVAPIDGERLIIKTEASAFGSGFGAELDSRNIEWLLVAGVWTEACVDATVKDALKRDLRVLLVKDACGSATEAMHQTGILNLANRLYGGAVVDTDAACRLLAGKTVNAWQPDRPVPIRYEAGTIASLYEAM